MPFLRGSEAAEQESASSFSDSRLQFLSWKDGDKHLLRFYDDRDMWPVVQIHVLAPTKPKPRNRGENSKWPAQMTATCQNDKGFRVVVDGAPTDEWEEGMGQCWIHANYGEKLDRFNNPYSRSTSTTHARVILRKRVGQGSSAQTVDDMEERTVTDKDGVEHKLMLPKIRVIANRYAKIFGGVNAAAFESDTVRAMDFNITRSGSDYHVAAGQIQEKHRPGTESWAIYDKAVEVLGEAADLEHMLRYQASDEWYKLWFIPGPWDTEERKGDTESASAGTAVADEGSLTPEQEAEMAAHRERLLAMSGKGSSSS